MRGSHWGIDIMRLTRFVIALAALAGLLLAGCATQKRSDTLTTTLTAYASAVRWGDFASAQAFVDPKVRQEHPLSALDIARFSQVRVTGYDEGNGPIPAGADQVQQIVHLNLINNNTQTERSLVDHQTWRYDASEKRWWLESGLPDITEH
jgi:hypothetical protein